MLIGGLAGWQVGAGTGAEEKQAATVSTGSAPPRLEKALTAQEGRTSK